MAASKERPDRLRNTGIHRVLRVFCTLVFMALALSMTACVGMVYAFKSNAAASKLEQAKTLRAARLAEYEYYFAKAHLLKAQEEAAEASYGDAIKLADIAEEYADKAIELSRGAHRSSGR